MEDKTKPTSKDFVFFVKEIDTQIKTLEWLITNARDLQQTNLIAYLQGAIRSLEYARNRALDQQLKLSKKESKA